LKRANQLDCEFIATGHYAQIRQENNRFVISKGLDEGKDQSYVLWGLSQENLGRTIFPLGGYRKEAIREMAIKEGFMELANKSESYEICFVPDNDYRAFLKHRVKDLDEKVSGGLFVSTEGKVLGKHKGYPFYTIGQRKGLDIALGFPAFVTEIIPETNTVILGTLEDLEAQEMWVRNYNLIKYPNLENKTDFLTRIRYKDQGTMASIREDQGKLKVLFHEKVKAIAPGQSAVFYEGNDLVGGGFIEKKPSPNKFFN
jgi:tRNA-specific 2-thiouridylase